MQLTKCSRATPNRYTHSAISVLFGQPSRVLLKSSKCVFLLRNQYAREVVLIRGFPQVQYNQVQECDILKNKIFISREERTET